jgi:hypothetical protein
MIDVFEVAGLLVSHAVENYGNDVDLIAYYGSQARGDAGPGSDLDLFYTPAEGKTPPIGRTFLLNDVLFDFWGLRWETLEGFATGAVRGWAFAPALVRQATPLYVRTSEQAERLEGLKRQSGELEKAESRPAMMERAQESFGRVIERLGSLHLAAADGGITDVRYAGWQLIGAVWECLALVNQVTFDRGLHRALAQPEMLTHRPANLTPLIHTISTSQDMRQVQRAADELAAGTYHVLLKHVPTQPAKGTIAERFDQVYPEMKDIVRKLLAACDAGDRVAASLEAYSVQNDVASILATTEDAPPRRSYTPYADFAAGYRRADLPDLIALSSGPLDELAGAALRFDNRLRDRLTEHGTDLCEFATIDELRGALEAEQD